MQLPCRAPRPTRASALPLYPTLRMTCEPRAIVGGVGAASGWLPSVITSGLYTWSWPFGARIVASMNTPSVSPLTQVQPSPSTHGVARPLAVSGRAGTVTVQFIEFAASACVWAKLNAFPAASTAFDPARPTRPAGLMGGMPATVAAAAAGAAEPDADGQGAGAAEAAADAGALAPAAGALAAGAGPVASAAGPVASAAGPLASAAGPLASAAGALASAAGALASAAGALALAAGAGALALAAAESHEPRADCAMVVALPPETARMIPRVRPSAIGMASGTAIRAARLFRRRRDADPCPLSIQSTSMWVSPMTLPVHHRRPGPTARSENSKYSLHVRLF